MNHSKKLLTTDDTALATYLYLQDVSFIHGTIKTEVKHRKAFLFREQTGIYKMIQDFYDNNVLVSPLDYQAARAQVTKWLKNDVTSSIKIKKEK